MFPPGVTNQTVIVQALGDAYNEISESFAVDLSHAVNAAIAIPRGYGVILDDDPIPSLSIRSDTVAEGDEGAAPELVFQVNLSAASGQTVTVNYASVDGTALAGLDYIATSGTLTFPPGTKESFEKYLALKPDGSQAESAKGMLTSMDVQIATEYKNPAAAPKKGVIVDLSALKFLASIGIRALIVNAKAVEQRGGKMVLVVNGASTVMMSLDATGVNELMPVFTNAAEAEKAALD